jgi:alpha-ketoglutarate-dependent 2,4-dichlorophenoxyacetate dioxygenase
MALRTTELHPKFGKIIHDVDLSKVTENHLYPEIRALFETHSALLFPAQTMDDAAHTRLAKLFGPLENRDAMAAGRDVEFSVSPVSNETADGGVTDAQALHTLNLQSNMLWHTDSTFLPIPALVNILTAKVVPSTGGQTELASTRVGWAEMPEDMRAPFSDAILWHRLSHSRSKISAELAALNAMTKWPDRPWRAIWRNPVTDEDALFIASHAFAIEGLGLKEGEALIEQALAFCTRPENVYSHNWQVGDVLIWDERATLHRGQPWPYHEPRTLMSICCSVSPSDGLASVKLV